MSELYPTQEEYQEMMNEIYARDPDLYDYIMYAEYEPPEFDLDALEERLYLMDGIDLVTMFGVTSDELGEIRDTNLHHAEMQYEEYRKRFGV